MNDDKGKRGNRGENILNGYEPEEEKTTIEEMPPIIPCRNDACEICAGVYCSMPGLIRLNEKGQCERGISYLILREEVGLSRQK